MDEAPRHKPPTARWPRWVFSLTLTLLVACFVWQVTMIDARPLHGDEAVQSYILGELLEGKTRVFDPEHFHGLLPHFLNAGWMSLAGKHGYADLDAFDIRAGHLLAGWAALALMVFWVYKRLGAKPAIIVALLWGLCPLAVYYNPIYFHENFLLLTALGVSWTLYNALKTQRNRWWAATGWFLGFLISIKATWLLIVISWGCAALALFALDKFFKQNHPPLRVGWRGLGDSARIPQFKSRLEERLDAWRGVIAALIGAVVIAAVVYTNAFTHLQGAWDAVRTYVCYATDPGHEKPWTYFLSDILFYKDGFGQVAITLPALLGFAAIVFNGRWRAACPRVFLWLALSGAAQIVAYSIINYKTSWTMLVPLACLAPFSAWVFFYAFFGEGRTRAHGWAGAGLLATALLFDASQILRSAPATESRAAPPFAYVPTSVDVPQLVGELLKNTPSGDIAVISDGPQIWPLPWYLRGAANRTAYHDNAQIPPGDFAAYIFVNYAPDKKTALSLREHFIKKEGILFVPGQPFSVYWNKPPALH